MDWVDKIPWDIVCREAKEFNLDHKLIAAIIRVESSCNPYVYRYEKDWEYRERIEYFARINGIQDQDELILQKTSLGLMQVMGTVARERGFRKSLLMLVEPEIGIEIGCRHLAFFRDVHHYQGLSLISAYNCGTPRFNEKGEFQNQGYVNKVLQRIKEQG